MNKKLMAGVSATLLMALLAGCGNNNQAKQNTASQSNSSSVSSNVSSNSNEKTSCVGSYSNKDIKTAMRVYKDGTAHYVYYDPDNGNTDDKKITWKYLGMNGTAHDQYKLNFHDKNISAPVILTVSRDSIILTSKDKNWNRQVLYRTLTPVNLEKFLANGGTSDDYEYRGPANSSSAGGSDSTDPTSNGISEAKAKQLLSAHGVSTSGLIGERMANGWTFRTKDMPLGTQIYTVLDSGDVMGDGIDQSQSERPNTNNGDANDTNGGGQTPSVGADIPSGNYRPNAGEGE